MAATRAIDRLRRGGEAARRRACCGRGSRAGRACGLLLILIKLIKWPHRWMPTAAWRLDGYVLCNNPLRSFCFAARLPPSSFLNTYVWAKQIARRTDGGWGPNEQADSKKKVAGGHFRRPTTTTTSRVIHCIEICILSASVMDSHNVAEIRYRCSFLSSAFALLLSCVLFVRSQSWANQASISKALCRIII